MDHSIPPSRDDRKPSSMLHPRPNLSYLKSSVSGCSVTGVSNTTPLYTGLWLSYPRLVVSIAKENQHVHTEVSERADSVVGNRTFNFKKDAQLDETQLRLCRKKIDDQIHERLDFFELDKSCIPKLSSEVITPKVSTKSKYKHLFALVIGINKYKSAKHRPLTGCANDIHAMVSFLFSIGVPKSNICTLKDEEATREAMLSSFQKHLINNDRIQKDDPIVFYFAGHGSRIDAPKEWITSDGKTETICPYDDRTLDGKNEEIPGIPARTINELFRKLAGVKGNNIVAIFDSCYSGVICRDEGVVRSTEGCSIRDPHLDAEICGMGRAATFDIPQELVYESMSSHVLLAACKREGTAYETRDEQTPRGEFTNALIQSLGPLFGSESDRVTIGSYQELIERLPPLPNGQIPQSGGINVKRVLFDAKDPPVDGSFPIKRLGDKDHVEEYEVEAGTIHGVSVGTEFRIRDSSYSGVLVAKTVDFQSSILIPAPRHRANPDFSILSKGARVVVSNWTTGESILKVYYASDSNNQSARFLKSPETTTERLQYFYVQVLDRKNADVVLRHIPSESVLEIERTDKIIGDRAERQIRVPLPKGKLDKLPFILDAIALFRYRLLWSVSDRTMLQDIESPVIMFGTHKVEMQLLRLDEWRDGFRNSIKPEKNLFEGDHARIRTSEDRRYGIKIINHTSYGFYPYLFYFDPSNYSIKLMSRPYARQMNAPLHASENGQPGQFTIGYGGTGTDPIRLRCMGSIPDTGFFKLFISTVHVDMEYIAQRAVVEAASGRIVDTAMDEPLPIGRCLMAVVTVEP